MKPIRIAALVLSLLFALSFVSGCSRQAEPDVVSSVGTSSAAMPLPSVPQTSPQTGTDEARPLSTIQYNSLNMLNYLVALTQEVNASRSSRLYLEQTYIDLYTNTSPESVDAATLRQIKSLLNAMEKYRMSTVKWERLEYIHDQRLAKAVREALPSQLSVMNIMQSSSLKKLIGAVVYMGIESYANYQASAQASEEEFLLDGWALDDEAAAVLHQTRLDTFEYMVDTVRAYGLPGHLALSETAVADFVEWKNKSNNARKIQFFESNEETYRAFGPYWLTLVHCYYEAEDYEACLRAMDAYEALNITIFRNDYELAQTLPLAIVAAKSALPQDEYIRLAARYAKTICQNTDNSDWELRYFAAQTYVELYALSQNQAFLDEAFSITLDNVNCLIEEQQLLNQVYLADVQKAEVPENASKEQKAEINAYNRLLVQRRASELPPVSEPLLLNCELLFALAREKDIDEKEQRRIDAILHGGESAFLVEPLNGLYRFDGTAANAAEVSAQFSGSSLTLSAQYVSDRSVITVTVYSDDQETVFDDWTISKVNRPDKGDPASFTAVYTSASAKSFSYQAGMTVRIEISAGEGIEEAPVCIDYQVNAIKRYLVFPGVSFERIAQ